MKGGGKNTRFGQNNKGNWKRNMDTQKRWKHLKGKKNDTKYEGKDKNVLQLHKVPRKPRCENRSF